MFTALKIPTSFNYSVSAWMIGDEQSKKLAVLLPGFLDTKDYAHLKSLGETLSGQGGVVISFDALGIWESNEAPVELYSMTNWLKETNDVINWAKQTFSGLGTVSLIGHSLGGTISLLAAAERKDISAVCAIMSPSKFVRPETYQKRMVEWKAEQVKTSLRDNPDGSDQKVAISLDFAFVEDSLQYDVAKVADQIRCPVLQIAGEKDVLVLPQQVQDIADKISHAQIEVLQEMGHDYRKNPEFIQRVNKEIIHFLKEKC